MLRVAPYRRLARDYDEAIGRDGLAFALRSLDRMIRRHHIRFASAADLGCGTGALACRIAEAFGVPVIGVDRSDAMLEQARRRTCDPRVRFQQGDLRAVRLRPPVDLVTMMHDTINHVLDTVDLEHAFESIALSLVPGGYVMFDALTDRPRWRPGRRYAWRLPSRCGRLEQWVRWCPDRRLLLGGVVHRATGAEPIIEYHDERAWSPAELVRAMVRARLRPVGVHDAATLEPMRDCPERVLVVARRW